MTSEYITLDELQVVLFSLMPQNSLIVRTALFTGLRITDVLNFTTKQAKQKSFTVTECKTGKKRKITLPPELRKEILKQASNYWAFPGREPSKPKTRQAVWYDLKRACKAFRLNINLSPHSIRKTYATLLYKKTGDLSVVKDRLNHDDIQLTLIYAMADELRKARHKIYIE